VGARDQQFRELVAASLGHEVAALCVRWGPDIDRLAAAYGVSPRDVLRQVLMHAPQLALDDLRAATALPEVLEAAVEWRFAGYPGLFVDTRVKAGASEFSGVEKLVIAADGGMEINDGSARRLVADEVSADVARTIEERLHFLRCARPGSGPRLGMCLAWHACPLAYLCVMPCAAGYPFEAVRGHGLTDDPAEVRNIARVYGLPPLPHNTLSKLYAITAEMLRAEGVRYLVTAVNPYLRFAGRSVLAAGFVPAAFAPVAYRYNRYGGYVGPAEIADGPVAQWQPPPNVLFVRPLDRLAYRQVTRLRSILKFAD